MQIANTENESNADDDRKGDLMHTDSRNAN